MKPDHLIELLLWFLLTISLLAIFLAHIWALDAVAPLQPLELGGPTNPLLLVLLDTAGFLTAIWSSIMIWMFHKPRRCENEAE